MRYTLKDYQEDAVAEVLANLRDGREDWHRKKRPSAFSLTATTGAGKTVMAAVAIEALFDGQPDYDFEADPGAVVLWFTDDPSLNEQTRFKLMEAADKISHSRLVVIENSFNQEKLAPGKVYFLNRQKLSKNAMLVRGAPSADPDDTQQNLEHLPPPDNRAQTMWDILRNTIEDPNLTLYLVLDEAHRGMKRQTRTDTEEKSTIVQRLINGANGTPPVPVVWGISATVERFDEAMDKSAGRVKYPNVVVDPARVQESGLLKDDIRLDFPAETGVFDTSLLRRATRLLKSSTQLWRQYADAQNEDAVVPLMVVQMPNKPTDDDLRGVFESIYSEWPELEADAIANVFGEHADIEVAGFTARYIYPQMVQDHTHIRVLLAKDAISTGWDCPRAEVFVSFRNAKDVTYITQLLGRMVRTPLARRIPGHDLLNSVVCVLPKFDEHTATEVARAMTGDSQHDNSGTGGGEGRRVLTAPVDMTVNPAIGDAVWRAFDALPSHTLPRKAAKAVSRLTSLAQALSRDGLRKGAVAEAYGELCKELDALCKRYPDKLKAAEKSVQEVSGITRTVGVGDGAVADEQTFTEAADERAIAADYAVAGRLLGRELAGRYVRHLADPEDDDTLRDAEITVAAIGRMETLGTAPVVERLEREADKLARKWFDQYRVAVKSLSDERRAVYADIKGMSPDPQTIEPQRPRIRTENTQDDEGKPLATRPLHLMADNNGQFPVASLNQWEISVLDAELERDDCLGWYRNPSRASDDALAVAWRDEAGNWRRMCPDFLFFHGTENDVKVSIVDPHGYHLSDALPKLRGLASFAAEFGDQFHRIESIAKMDDDSLRVLDMTEAPVREAVATATDAKALFASQVARQYVV
ncbi:MAG: DEAD/DEAH box helicase family protein [Wenzhouxiangella sp.]|nr:DEAD/DEAH box helicase family protein [Wenzhouxiangella sp.]